MAIAQPAPVYATYGQDVTATVTLTTYESISGWTVSAVMRAYKGGPAIATGVAVPTDTGTVASWLVTFASAGLTTPPGAYVWDFVRTNAAAQYPICDSSVFHIEGSGSAAYPTMTNLSEYLVSQQASMTVTDADAMYYLQTLAAAEAIFLKLIDRKLTYKAGQVFYLDGTGTPDVLIPRTPVVTLTSVYLDTGGWYGSPTGAFDSTTLLVAGEDYVLVPDSPDGDGLSYAGVLRKIGGVWPRSFRRAYGMLSAQPTACPGCIKVTASVGYTLIPYDVKQAIFDATTQLAVNGPHARIVQSESGEGYSYGLGSFDPVAELMRVGSFQAAVLRYRKGTSFMR